MEKQKKKTQWIRIDAHSVRTLRQPTKQEKKLNRTTWKGLHIRLHSSYWFFLGWEGNNGFPYLNRSAQ